jgi:putative component of membrane protein insertase Oxa1/YidC/SpoIIIJ protein YidD
MRLMALAAIRAYQHYVSPYKGFRCAYAVVTGRASCSALGYRTIRRHGVIGGIALLRKRTRLCAVVHHRAVDVRQPRAWAERGFCDCDLPCDVSCCDVPDDGGLCDLADCCDCDWPSRTDKRRAEAESSVYVPFTQTRRPQRGDPKSDVAAR